MHCCMNYNGDKGEKENGTVKVNMLAVEKKSPVGLFHSEFLVQNVCHHNGLRLLHLKDTY